MARPKTNELAVRDFHKAVDKLARKNPARPKDIELWAYATHGVYVSSESLRKAFNGTIDPTACAMELLVAIKGFYGVPSIALGHFAAERMNPFFHLAGIDPDSPGGQVSDASGWFRATPHLRAV